MDKIFLHLIIINLSSLLEFAVYVMPFVYSFRKRKTFTVRLSVCLIAQITLLCLFSYISFICLKSFMYGDVQIMEWIRIGVSFPAFFINTGVLFICFDEQPVVLIYAAIAGKAAQIIFGSVYGLLNNITGSVSVYMFLLYEVDIWSLLFYFISHAVVLPFIFFLFGKPFAKMQKEFGKTLNVYLVSMYSVILFVAIFFCGNNIVFLSEDKAVHNIFTFFIILFCLTILLVERFMLFWEKDRKDKVETEIFYENYKTQTEAVRLNMESVNIKCHDLKHQIRNMLGVKNLDEQFLNDVQKTISIYDTQIKTGNEHLDVLLTEKSLLCEVNGIDLCAMIDGEGLSFMAVSDINSFFGNALDNAIEYLRKNEEADRRFIRITSKRQNGIFTVRIENYCSQVPVIDKYGFPETTKEDKGNHGFGVRSMKKIVEKYGGTLTFKTENELFTVLALFNV